MKYNIEDWERIVWRDENASDRFIDYFLKDEFSTDNIMFLADVSWNSCSMKVVYVLDSGQHISTSFTMSLWEEFYNEYR